MAMQTTPNPQPNPTMAPAPTSPEGQEANRRAARANQPRATSDYPQQRDPMFDDPQRRDPSHRFDHAAASRAYDERLLDVSEPYLPEDFDRALVARVYPEAESTKELRELAIERAREVYELAARATAAADMPIPGVEDQRDPRTIEREGRRTGVQRATRPNMPRADNPDNRPEQTTPPDQPPGPDDMGPDHQPGDVQPAQQQEEQRRRVQEREQQERQQRQEQEERHRQERERAQQEDGNKKGPSK